MKHGAAGVFFEVAESVIGRAVLFSLVFGSAAVVGSSIAAGEFAMVFHGFAYVVATVWAMAGDGLCAGLSLCAAITLFIYLRFDVRHSFLFLVALLAGLHGYFVFRFCEF